MSIAEEIELVDSQNLRFSPPASLSSAQSPLDGPTIASPSTTTTNSSSSHSPLPSLNQRKVATDGPRRRRSSQNVGTVENNNLAQSQSTQRMELTESEGSGGTHMMTERCVLVARQSDGFGLTVTGEHPIKVATVKANGAAQMAGVRQGDRILKVNGMLVSGDNFQEVIKMISGGYNLALTLLGLPARRLTSISSWDDELFPPLSQPKWTHQKQPMEIVNNKIIRQPSNGGNNASFTRRSTRTKIMETDKMLDAEWRQQRAQELFRMLHRERTNLDSLRQQHDLENGQNCANLLDRALCRVNELERQLHILSLLNSVTENNPNLCAKIDQQQFDDGKNESDEKRGSIESGDMRMEKESSKTFPPASLRTTPAVASPQIAAPAGKPMEPIRSWVETGGMHYGQADVIPIGGEEEDEEDDEDDNDENNRFDGDEQSTGPFGNLQNLKTRPGHMAVFFTFLFNSANPSSLLFYLISDAYPFANVKEMRRFAYELFSTFLIPDAPLQLPGIAQRDIQAIDKVLRATSSTSTDERASSNMGKTGGGQQAAVNAQLDQLRKLFIPTRTRAVGQINEQLVQFRRKRRHSEQVVGIEAAQLDAVMARADHAGEIRLAERLLYRALAQLVHLASPNGPPDWENCERKTLALIISVSTLIKIVLGIRTNNSGWEKLLEKCPTFLTPSPKSTAGSVFKMRSSSKNKIQVKEHQFHLQPVFLTVHCYQCREAVWGVNPQAYFCQNCDVVIHKNCTSQLIDHCWPQQQQKSHYKGSIIPQPFQPISNSAAGRQKFVSASQTSLISAPTSGGGIRQIKDPLHPIGRHQHPQQHQHHQQFLHHRDSNASSAIYSQSLFGGPTESLFSTPAFHHTHRAELVGQKGVYRKLLPSHLSSISLTPPLNRSHHSVSVVAMAGSSKESSRSIDRHGDDLIPPELIDAAEGGQGKSGTQIQRCQQHARLESLDSGSTPPSSQSAMLPPPVFSSKFERILPPDIPPNAPPPPLPPAVEESATKEDDDKKSVPVSSSTPKKLASEPAGPQKSMDSGIGTEGGAGKKHSNAGPTRSQSMKGEAANQQLKRGGKGAGSLGAADSTADDGIIGGGGYERPIGSQLAVPSAQSLKSSSSSAQDLQQAFNEFPQYIRAIEAIASSSTAASANEEEVRKMLEKVERMVIADGDSDLEIDTEIPNLESLISWEVLKHLKPKEKKRQEVINEFFHTERTHVRNLKILYKVFYRPMVVQRVAPPELIKLLFGNLDELLQAHSEMHQKMKMALEIWRRGEGAMEGGLYGDVGELVEAMFDGPAGERLMRATAMFCQNQQHALDTLRQRYTRSKEDQFSQFLAEAENNPLCRKLQLKDIIPVEMQRLVKYPLLLETIAKYTKEGSDELQRLLHGVECAKRLVSEVNSAKRNAENIKRMDELQRRLDMSGSEKNFFQKFDFRMHKLIYEGSLQWRKDKGKTLDLHVVLLEHLLVFLTKVGTETGTANQQKLQLKIHEAGTIPIMRLASVKVDEKTGDKRAFNLLYTCDLRVFELVAQTATERKTWFRLIENQVSITRSSPTAAAEIFLDGMAPPGSGSPSIQPVGAGQSTPTQAQRARIDEGGGINDALQMANVEQVHVLTHPSLVNANEIIIQQPTVMENAQPVLSMAERLKRSDKMIFAALAEKHRILAELICEEQNATPEELERITELMTGLSVGELKQQRAPRELAMSAIVHGNRLLESINKGMSVKLSPETATTGDSTISEKPTLDQMERHLPSVPCYRLTAVAAPLMNHLKALLQVIQEQETEIANLKESLREANPANRKMASDETLTQNDHFFQQKVPSRVSSGASMIVLKTMPNPEASSPY